MVLDINTSKAVKEQEKPEETKEAKKPRKITKKATKLIIEGDDE